MGNELFHSLRSKRICFRAMTIGDVDEIHSIASDEEVSRFIGWKLTRTVDETMELVQEMLRRDDAGTHMYASVILQDTAEVIGTAMLFGFDREANHAELGYVFHKNQWGKGYGTETVAMMECFAFEQLGLHKLHARVVDGNCGSAHVLEKNGVVLEGRFKDYYYIDKKFHDGLFYGKLQPLWR